MTPSSGKSLVDIEHTQREGDTRHHRGAREIRRDSCPLGAPLTQTGSQGLADTSILNPNTEGRGRGCKEMQGRGAGARECPRHQLRVLPPGVSKTQLSGPPTWSVRDTSSRVLPPGPGRLGTLVRTCLRSSIPLPCFCPLLLRRGNLLPNLTAADMKTCRFHPDKAPFCPILRVGDVVKFAGQDFAKLARTVRT